MNLDKKSVHSILICPVTTIPIEFNESSDYGASFTSRIGFEDNSFWFQGEKNQKPHLKAAAGQMKNPILWRIKDNVHTRLVLKPIWQNKTKCSFYDLSFRITLAR